MRMRRVAVCLPWTIWAGLALFTAASYVHTVELPAQGGTRYMFGCGSVWRAQSRDIVVEVVPVSFLVLALAIPCMGIHILAQRSGQAVQTDGGQKPPV